jgi:hypothetical protein
MTIAASVVATRTRSQPTGSAVTQRREQDVGELDGLLVENRYRVSEKYPPMVA